MYSKLLEAKKWIQYKRVNFNLLTFFHYISWELFPRRHRFFTDIDAQSKYWQVYISNQRHWHSSVHSLIEYSFIKHCGYLQYIHISYTYDKSSTYYSFWMLFHNTRLLLRGVFLQHIMLVLLHLQWAKLNVIISQHFNCLETCKVVTILSHSSMN